MGRGSGEWGGGRRGGGEGAWGRDRYMEVVEEGEGEEEREEAKMWRKHGC